MTTGFLIAVAVIWLAWSNGANDNFKGVATLWGSQTTTYRHALIWATGATILGSVVSIAIAGALVKTFSGAGLVGAETATRPALLLAVATAAAGTVLLATFLGMPTSTTHALTGGLVGASLVAVGPGGIDWGLLLQKFAQPLLLSPLLAIGGTAIIYLLLRTLRGRLGIERHTCLCIPGRPPARLPAPMPAPAAITRSHTGDRRGFALAPASECVERYDGQVVGVQAQTVVDVTHFASAGAVCFARAVNDTPKIA
ncbi:MAG: inorganic phosphate transporter, partial [Phycisphaerales bacterium]|nr:inorganic phosphate transporter [Phycisphaerales bacterium]